MADPSSKVQVNLPAQSDLKFKTACLCVHCGIFTKMPDMLGCTGKTGCLCMNRAFSLKIAQHKTCMNGESSSYCFDLEKDYMGADGWQYSESKGKCCFVLEGAAVGKCAKAPFVLVKGGAQNLCCDVRCAIPFDDEVPMQIAVAGVVLFPAGQQKM